MSNKDARWFDSHPTMDEMERRLVIMWSEESRAIATGIIAAVLGAAEPDLCKYLTRALIMAGLPVDPSLWTAEQMQLAAKVLNAGEVR